MTDPDRPEDVNAKLVAVKQTWAAEKRGLTGEPPPAGKPKLPPGQHEVKAWPVLDLGNQPQIPLEEWELVVDGLVENPIRWSWADFIAQPQTEDVSDMHCVTSWSRFDNRWQGVSAKHLISVVRPKPNARHVLFHSYDGYTTNLRLKAFAEDDVLLVHRWEGEPISAEHGGPVRVIVPKIYLWKSAKWLRRIEFLALDQPGFWETRGYHNEGDPWTEERYG